MKKTYMTPATSQYKVELQQMIALSRTEDQATTSAVALGKDESCYEEDNVWDEEE